MSQTDLTIESKLAAKALKRERMETNAAICFARGGLDEFRGNEFAAIASRLRKEIREECEASGLSFLQRVRASNTPKELKSQGWVSAVLTTPFEDLPTLEVSSPARSQGAAE